VKKKVIVVTICSIIISGFLFLKLFPFTVLNLTYSFINLFDRGPSINYEDRTDTLAGIDLDNNGLRDDVEKYISDITAEYNEEVKKMLSSVAKAEYSYLLLDNYSDLDVRSKLIVENDRLTCYFLLIETYHLKHSSSIRDKRKNIRKLIFNTYKRKSVIRNKINYNLSVPNRKDMYNLTHLDKICGFHIENINEKIAQIYYSRGIGQKNLTEYLRKMSTLYPFKVNEDDRNEIINIYNSYTN